MGYYIDMAKMAFHTNLTIHFLREGKRFIAYSPALDLSTSGKTYEEAKRRFQEAAQLFFEEIMRKGVLKDVLDLLPKSSPYAIIET